MGVGHQQVKGGVFSSKESPSSGSGLAGVDAGQAHVRPRDLPPPSTPSRTEFSGRRAVDPRSAQPHVNPSLETLRQPPGKTSLSIH